MSTSAPAAAPTSPALTPIPGFGEFRATSLATSMIISNLLNWALLGILCVQVYTYYLAFPKDRSQLKVLVYFILAVQTAQTMICTRDAFIIFARSFGNILVLDNIHTLWLSYPVMGGVVGWLYQCHSGYRVFRLGRFYMLGAAIIVLLSTCGMVAAIGFGVRIHNAGGIRFSILDTTNFIWYGVWNIASALCDIIITGIMVYKLVKSQQAAEDKGLLVNRIIRLTVETGMVTACAAIASVVVFLGYRHTPLVSSYFLVPGLILGKLYGITLLAALNSRLEVVGGRHREYSSGDRKVTFPGFRRPFENANNSVPPPILVETHRSVWVDNPTGPEPVYDLNADKGKSAMSGSDVESI